MQGLLREGLRSLPVFEPALLNSCLSLIESREVPFQGSHRRFRRCLFTALFVRQSRRRWKAVIADSSSVHSSSRLPPETTRAPTIGTNSGGTLLQESVERARRAKVGGRFSVKPLLRNYTPNQVETSDTAVQGMDQPLTSSDHLGDGDMGSSSRVAEEAGGNRTSFSFTRLGMGGTDPAALASPARRGSLAARYGLLAVAEIQSKDLRWVVTSGAAMTMVFLILGVAWFMFSDKWNFTETVYFMCTSLMTIGYGDIVVSSEGQDRFIDSLLILFGLAILAIGASCVSQPLYHMRPRKAVGERPMVDFDVEAEIRRCCWMLAYRIILVVVVTILGLVVFMIGEDRGFATSFYWVIVTSSSVGYGDVVPSTRAMRWFTSFYCIVATGAMLEMLRFAGMFPFEIWTLRAEGKVFDQFAKAETSSERTAARSQAERAVTEVLRLSRDDRGGGDVSRSDVALSVLLLLDRVSYEDVQQAARIYDNVGLSQDGAASTVTTLSAGPKKT